MNSLRIFFCCESGNFNMKSNLGQTLRKIRKSKNISITQLEDDYLSKSQISRFERGESEISFFCRSSESKI